MNMSLPFSRLTALFLVIAFFFTLPAVLSAQTTNDTKNFQYWFEKGSLLSVYGNQKAAVQALSKAIAFESENSEAHFNLGVAYAENGDYENAIAAVNRAIQLNSSVPHYHYGRGWIHLRVNNHDYGISDMQEAARLQHADAIRYLEIINPRHADSY